MADKLMFLLQLALVCSVTIGFVSSAALDDGGTIIQETDDEDEATGNVVHDQREVDSRCRYEKNTNTKADGTKNELLDDFVDGKSAFLFSNSSQDCFVRDIDTNERNEAGTCRDGMVQRDADKPDKEEARYVKSDTALTKEQTKELPDAIQVACKGKTIYKMLPRTAGSDQNNGTASRQKRQVGYRLCVRVRWVYRCIKRCYFRFVRYCRRRCYVFRYAHLVFC